MGDYRVVAAVSGEVLNLVPLYSLDEARMLVYEIEDDDGQPEMRIEQRIASEWILVD